MNDFLRQTPSVYFLGCGHDTAALITALNKDYGIEPLLFASHRPFSVNPFLRYRFRRLLLPGNKYYTVRSLLDLADGDSDRRIILLVPCTPDSEALAESYSDILETSFIIKSSGYLERLLPSYLLKRGLET